MGAGGFTVEGTAQEGEANGGQVDADLVDQLSGIHKEIYVMKPKN